MEEEEYHPFTPEKFACYVAKHPKPAGFKVVYGTTGPRDIATKMDAIIFRMGIFAALKSACEAGKAIGLMITGGSNPVWDNGVKLIDVGVGSLSAQWEVACEKLINTEDENIQKTLARLIKQVKPQHLGLVYIGRDMRATSDELAQAAIDGAKAVGCKAEYFGPLATPQLCHIVQAKNLERTGVSEGGYLARFIGAYKKLDGTIKAGQTKYAPHLNIDCANDVAGQKMQRIKVLLASHLKLNLHNTGKGIINHECGAEYVEKELNTPRDCNVLPGQRWASFSGDVGRVVYYYKNAKNELRVLNGNKIATLICSHVKELLISSGLWDTVPLKVVMSYYHNVKALKFLQHYIGVPIGYSAPGIKSLKETIGSGITICFEPSGVGSVFFSASVYEKLVQKIGTDKSGPLLTLLRVYNLMPQTTSDGLSTLLLIESILKTRDWTIQDWDMMYDYHPWRMINFPVKDRNFIKLLNNSSIVAEPEELREEIAKLTTGHPEARIIIRPSGTQNIIRIYAEAETQEKTNVLFEHAVRLAYTYCN